MVSLHFISIVVILTLCNAEEQRLAALLWHGMGDHGKSGGLQAIASLIEQEIPGTYVHSVMTRDSIIYDIEDSYFMPAEEQVNLVCQMVLKHPNLSRGFHAIGFSQGGLLVRALVQKCPIKQLGALVSVGGPQQGVFGLPNCPVGRYSYLCRFVRRLLSIGAYKEYIQQHLVQAQYWHDPTEEEVYRKKSIFLADINQERFTNDTYKKNMKRLKHFVLIGFLNDTMVYPKESEWFGYYEPGSVDKKLALRDTAIYKEDKLGLKELDDSNRLHFLATEGNHLQFSLKWFTENVIRPYLN